MAELRRTLREAAYVAVGAGVLGFQRAQVRRQELGKQLEGPRQELEAQLDEARRELTSLARELEPVLKGVAEQLGQAARELQARVRSRPDQGGAGA